MYKFVLEADENTLIFLGDEKFEIIKNKPKILEVDAAKNLEFLVLPKLEFAQILNFEISFEKGNCFSKYEKMQVIKIEDGLYFLKIFVKNCTNHQKKCKKIVKNGLFFNFFENGYIEIENQDTLLFCEQFDFSILDAEVMELKNDAYCLKLFGKNNAEKSVIIDKNFVSVLSFDSAVEELTENGFKVLTDLHDIACHGLVEVFEVEEEISKVDEYSVYLKGSPVKKFNTNVLPIYFLQCVKANDFFEAKRCLSDELKNKATNENIKNYFGNFSDILAFNGKTYLVYHDSSYFDKFNNFFAKEFSFKIANNQIIDIF